MIAEQDASPNPTDSPPNLAIEPLVGTAARLLALLQQLVRETHPSGGTADPIDLDSHLDRDLALDSLTRTELLRRIEQTFQIVLGERLLLAETPRDLVRLIRQAESEAGVQDAPAERMDSRVEREVVPRLSSAGIPERVATLIDMLDWHTQAHPNQSAIQIQGSNEQIEAAFTLSLIHI